MGTPGRVIGHHSRELGGDIGRGIGDLIKMTAKHSLEDNSTHLTSVDLLHTSQHATLTP